MQTRYKEIDQDFEVELGDGTPITVHVQEETEWVDADDSGNWEHQAGWGEITLDHKDYPMLDEWGLKLLQDKVNEAINE